MQKARQFESGRKQVRFLLIDIQSSSQVKRFIMERDMNTPRTPGYGQPGQPTYASQSDGTPRKESDVREGGDDALTQSSPTDPDSDEKVIVNEQRANKTVNAPSQTAANTSEANSYDDEIVDRRDTGRIAEE
jgi:hypothetical protein